MIRAQGRNLANGACCDGLGRALWQSPASTVAFDWQANFAKTWSASGVTHLPQHAFRHMPAQSCLITIYSARSREEQDIRTLVV